MYLAEPFNSFDPRVLREKLRAVLHVAALGGCRHLVLGAFGCGYFGNPPAAVANACRELLCSGGEFASAFDVVVFAVPARFGSANADAFRERFPPADADDVAAAVARAAASADCDASAAGATAPPHRAGRPVDAPPPPPAAWNVPKAVVFGVERNGLMQALREENGRGASSRATTTERRGDDATASCTAALDGVLRAPPAPPLRESLYFLSAAQAGVIARLPATAAGAASATAAARLAALAPGLPGNGSAHFFDLTTISRFVLLPKVCNGCTIFW